MREAQFAINILTENRVTIFERTGRPQFTSDVKVLDLKMRKETMARKPLFALPFGEWLIQQIDRNDPIGDLARAAKLDKDFDLEMPPGGFRNYLRDRQVDDAVMKVYRRAIEEYYEYVGEVNRKD